jgi:hypothetical protein
MTRRTSVVAFCCSNASSRSRVGSAISFSELIGVARLRTAIADRGRFGVALWRPALSGFPPIIEHPFITLPRSRMRHLRLRGGTSVPEVASRSAVHLAAGLPERVNERNGLMRRTKGELMRIDSRSCIKRKHWSIVACCRERRSSQATPCRPTKLVGSARIAKAAGD